VNLAARISRVVFLFLLSALPLRAANFSICHVGDIADADLFAPVALDVVDPAATTARQTAEAAKVPAIFRDFPNYATNALAADFTAACAAAHSRFLAAVRQTFQPPTLDANAVAAPEFTSFLAAFNAQHPEFPVPAALAAQWARGQDGAEIQSRLLSQLLQMMRRPVCADNLPASFVVGEKYRVVPVSRPDETPTLEIAEQKGKWIATTNLTSVARLRMLFRHNFPTNEPAVTAALAAFFRPVCAPDTALTQQSRDRAVREIVATEHFVSGQLIVRRGGLIDAKTKAAIDQLREKSLLPASFTIATAPENPRAAAPARDGLIWIALAAVAALSLATIIFAWRIVRLRPVAARTESAANFSPQVSQAVKDALVQELAATRVELLKAQQFAAAKIIPTNGHEHKNGNGNGSIALAPALEEHTENCIVNLLAEGQSLVDGNEFEKALKCFDAAFALQPDRAETLVKMGGVLDKLGRTDEALQSLDRAIAADDTLTIAYLQKGGLFNRLARYEEASQCYEKALLKQKKSAA